MVSIGVLTVGLLMIYNRVYGTRGAPAVEPTGQKGFRKKFMSSNLSIVVILLLIPGFLTMGYLGGHSTYYRGLGGTTEEGIAHIDFDEYDTITGFSEEITGSLQKDGSDTSVIPIQLEEGQYLRSITFELTWRDEPDPNALLENQPDEFSLSVSDEFNEHVDSVKKENSHGSEGSITIGFDFEHDAADSLNGTGNWEVEIRLENCGDSEGRLAIWTQEDNSNEYALGVSTEIYVPAG